VLPEEGCPFAGRERRPRVARALPLQLRAPSQLSHPHPPPPLQIETTAPPPVEHQETPSERRARRRADRAKSHALVTAQAAATWDPRTDGAATRDAYKTLFVARLAYETSERKLQREFEAFGPVERARIVKGRDGQSRGYGFVEFKEEDDLKRAYRRGDGLRIDGRRVLVDVERGRTVRGACSRRRGV
jgi:U1 small nuclear ribonucleoprotein 70kDa